MQTWLQASILVPTLLLLVASVLDVFSGKFPNWLFVASLVVGSLWLSQNVGMNGVMKSLGIAVLVFITLAPLVFLKALGAGDIKLLTAFSLFTNWQITVFVFAASLIWGLVLGLSKLVVAGHAKNFIQSFALRVPQLQTEKIPYTVAILLGWLTWVSQGGAL